MFDQMMARAKELEELQDNEWADAHEDEYIRFEEMMDAEYAAGNLTDSQYDELGNIALADFEPKCEY